MRPTIDFKGDLGAVLRYHCTKVGISIAGYVKGLVYDDLLKKYPNLLDETKKETVTHKPTKVTVTVSKQKGVRKTYYFLK